MKIFKLLLIVLLFSSCSKKIAFTSDIQSRHKFSEKTLKQVQFYTNKTIVLYKSSTNGDVDVNGGKLLITDNKSSDKIIIKKNTPCVLEKVISESLFIFSFEYGDGRVLAFGNNNGGYYSLMGKSWEGTKATLTYANQSYYTYSGDTYLVVKMKKLTNIQNRERTVKGRKIK